MLQLMHVLCLFAVLLLNDMITIAAVDEIIVNNTLNVSTRGATDKTNFKSTEMKHDLDTNQTDFHLLCSYLVNPLDHLYCDQQGRPIIGERCATFNKQTSVLSIFRCPYFQRDKYQHFWYKDGILLPSYLSELNDRMCGPLNRKGLVCSECADGFGPSVTSFGYRCANCTDAWYGLPLFLLLEFAPITVFYIICLAFRISVTSAPLPCFIMYAQIIVATFDSATSTTPTLYKVISKEIWGHRLDIKIALTIYRVFNLEFGHYLLPPYCLSSKLKFIHVAYLGYISAFYPLLLIFLTWLCVELHGRNFRPLVWLWRPFHRCFVRLRRSWDTKSDIIDVFTTFLLLSYGKIMYQTLLLINRDEILNIDQSGRQFTSYQCVADQSISYGSTYHLLFAIPSVLIFCICNLLPLLVLMLYPTKVFRSCLSKCHLNSIALNIFTERVYCCYRNGLHGGRDMRCFAGLYFILRIMPFLIQVFTRRPFTKYATNHWYHSGTLFFATSLLVGIAKPYKKPYMNYLDSLILSDLALIYLSFVCGSHLLLPTRILLLIPIAVFSIIMTVKIIRFASKPLLKCTCFKLVMSKRLSLRIKLSHEKDQQYHTIDGPTAAQPLIEPTSTVLSYSTCDNN